MNVLPQDLGEKRCEIIVALRAGTVQSTHAEPDEPLGFWGRRWLRKAHGPMSLEDRAVLQASRRSVRGWFGLAALPALAAAGIGMATVSDYLSRPYAYHDPLPAMVSVGAAGVSTWVFAVVQPRRLLKKKYRRLYEMPVSSAEVAALLPQTHDELERSYLTLVMDVTRQEVQTASSGASLRTALKSLGEAIDKLPATRVVLSDDHDIITEVLQRTAAATLQRAQEEPDRIAAASLMRRVEALHRRADATKRANTLTRRFSVLRQEMAAETEALRAGLTAYYSGAHDIADLTQLAEDMQRLATEAAALTNAAEEVDTFSAGRVPAALPTAPPAVNRVRLG